ncbi:ABC transporter substrate-binding protein [bacterium]|nr:ABC transporter substrate-binding protein [bacterium]
MNSNKKVFRYNSPSGISSLDPAFARTQENIRAVNQLFNGLVQLDADLNVIPSIAKSWEIDSSGKVYTFKIRKGVFFHKHPAFGKDSIKEVTAEDFVYSFNRILDPKLASDGAWIFNGTVSDSAAFKALNDSTLQIRLQRPFTPFLGLLSMAYCYVVPEDVIDEIGREFGTAPIGTGPFRFSNWEQGVRLNFIKNYHYFESGSDDIIPKLDAVSITFIQNKQTELLQLRQGNLDVFTGLESSFKDEILNANAELRSKYSKDFGLMIKPFLNTEFLAFQMESNSIFADKNFRKALNYGINRKAMISYLRNSVGYPASGGFTPKGLPGFVNTSPYSYDPVLAKTYLDESSYKQIEAPLQLYTTKEYLDLCVLVQKDLERLGVMIEINVIPSSLLKQQKSAGELNFFRGSWIADYPDAENYMACFYSKNKAPNGPNYCRFENDSFDYYYEQLLGLSVPEKKKEIITKLESILLDEVPFILLFYDESVWIYSKKIRDIKVNALNHLDLRYADRVEP